MGMLVLSRKKGEGVVVDGRARVSVVEIRGDKVRLGFVAERSVAIHRDEVWVTVNGDTPELGLTKDGVMRAKK